MRMVFRNFCLIVLGQYTDIFGQTQLLLTFFHEIYAVMQISIEIKFLGEQMCSTSQLLSSSCMVINYPENFGP